MAARRCPYSFDVALDGSVLNGLEGRAGVCVFRYDPSDNSYAYKVSYISGVAGGHEHLWRFDINLLKKTELIGPLHPKVGVRAHGA